MFESRDGAADVLRGFATWRIWWMLAANDVSRRYKRSRVGQLWLTLSMASMIMGMGLVYSTIFQQDIKVYLPYLATGIILWNFMAGCINEGATAFIEGDAMVRQSDLAKFSYILRVIVRNVLVFAHNLIILPIVFVVFGVDVGWTLILFVPGLILVTLNLAWVAYFLAIVSARFRDIPQIVQSIVQIAFFLSPVMFRAHQLAPDHPVILLNPFASLLAVFRDPLIGQVPPLWDYAAVGGMLIVGWMATLALASRYSRRVVYWL